MKKKVVALCAILALATPALALAASTQETNVQLQQLMVATAALEAQVLSLQTGNPLACVVLVSKKSVQVNEPFIIAWGAVGARDESGEGAVAPNGLSWVAFDKAGTWKYGFSFTSSAGAATSCSASITVLPQ